VIYLYLVGNNANVKSLQLEQLENMKNNNYEVDILINDKPIKKYAFENKIYVEAKPNQHYTIRIKNNLCGRILTATSVDSCNVISGKNEEVNSSPGYIVNGYNSLKIDGFRISDEEVAEFRFDKKDKSYAASKKDNSEQNVGIIGIRIFNEKIKLAPQPYINAIHNHFHHVDWNTYTPYPTVPKWPNNPIIWGGNGMITTTLGNTSTNYNSTLSSNGTSGHGEVFNCNNSTGHLKGNIVSNALNNVSFSNPLRGFDLGTSFGEKKESKVVEIDFERGMLVDSIDIFYASRESLIEMGIPLTNEKQINFPSAFKDSKYCVPPNNWKK
jgi:hypothetical protein